MVAHRRRYGDPARRGDALEPRGHVHAVAKYVVAFHDDVAEIDADTEFDAPRLRHVNVAFAHLALDIGGAGHRVHDARELHQHAVAGQLDDAAPMLGDLRVDQLAAVRLEGRERGALVGPHQAAVADDVGSQDRGQATFHAALAPVQTERSLSPNLASPRYPTKGSRPATARLPGATADPASSRLHPSTFPLS